MTALLPALAAWLAARGHGTYSTSTPYGPDTVGIVVGHVPASPDRCVGIATYGGSESNTNEPYDQVNVQIRVRGTDDERVSREHAQAIYDDLHGLGVIDLPGGVRLMNAVGLQGGPIYIGTDRSNRHENTTNFRVEYRNPTALRPNA